MATLPGVFNVTASEWGLSAGYSGSTNRAALQNMVSTLLDTSGPTGGNGGTIEFPSVGTFKFSGDPIVIGLDLEGKRQPYAIIIQGDGQGSESVPLIQKTDSGDLFQVNNDVGDNVHVGGVTFRDLQIDYSDPSTGAAIHVENGENVRIFRCVFYDCPQAIYFEESGGGSVIDCDVVYDTGVVGTALTLGNPTSDNTAVETYVAGCTFYATNSEGSVGVQVNSAEHLRLMNTRIDGFAQGILITPTGTTQTVRKLYFSNVSCFPGGTSSTTVGAAVLIQPANGNWATIITFAQCELAAPDGGTEYQGGGVIIDGRGGVVDNIRFVDCHVCKWPGPGFLVYGGSGSDQSPTDVEILGGYYSCNGGVPASGLPSAGIAVIGASNGPFGVRITGATCNNLLWDVVTGGGGGYIPQTQDYGISLENAQNVFIRGCDLTGNLTQALTATITTLTNVQISDCAGYNDQASTVKSSAPAEGVAFSPALYGYYGSATFYVTGGTDVSITVNTTTLSLTSGTFTLSPGETATLFYTAVPNFYMVGQ